MEVLMIWSVCCIYWVSNKTLWRAFMVVVVTIRIQWVGTTLQLCNTYGRIHRTQQSFILMWLQLRYTTGGSPCITCWARRWFILTQYIVCYVVVLVAYLSDVHQAVLTERWTLDKENPSLKSEVFGRQGINFQIKETCPAIYITISSP